MKNRIILVLLLPFIAEFFISCCDCGDPVEIAYSHCTVNSRLLDFSGGDPVVAENPEFILATEFGIELTLERSDEVCEIKPTSFSLFSEASALTCDCLNFDSSPRETVSEIRIYTLTDFNEDILAGSEVSDLFSERKFNGETLALSTATEEIIYGYSYVQYENYLLDLILTQAPGQQGDYQFRIEVELTDGRVLEVVTAEVFLS